MLDNLKVQNFRMLSNFEISKLGNVNLIVGKNNSGKSSVLEALRILAARGNPRVLQEIAASHDEMIAMLNRGEDLPDDEGALPFRDFFYGRQFPEHEANAIYIGDRQKENFVQIDHAFYLDEYEKVATADSEETTRRKRQIISKDTLLTEPIVAEQALVVTVSETQVTGWISLSDLPNQLNKRSPSALFWERAAKELPVSYVPTQFLSLDYLAQLWDSILFSPYADEVKMSLKILDDDFEDLAFVKTGSDDYRMDNRFRSFRLRGRYSDRTAVVKLKTSPTSIPLSSMGDGMLRVLQLALTVFPAKGGMLLIDEFENGLHWSVQEKIWTMIFKLANDLKIQVFATTHSEDAVRAFSNVASARPEEGVLIKLVRKPAPGGTGMTAAVVYDEETLRTATLTETEIR